MHSVDLARESWAPAKCGQEDVRLQICDAFHRHVIAVLDAPERLPAELFDEVDEFTKMTSFVFRATL